MTVRLWSASASARAPGEPASQGRVECRPTIAEARDEVVLVELGQEADGTVDVEPVDELGGPGRHVRVARPTHLADRRALVAQVVVGAVAPVAGLLADVDQRVVEVVVGQPAG